MITYFHWGQWVFLSKHLSKDVLVFKDKCGHYGLYSSLRRMTILDLFIQTFPSTCSVLGVKLRTSFSSRSSRYKKEQTVLQWDLISYQTSVSRVFWKILRKDSVVVLGGGQNRALLGEHFEFGLRKSSSLRKTIVFPVKMMEQANVVLLTTTSKL